MKKLALTTAIATGLLLSGASAWAHGNSTHSRNPNSATPAVPSTGSGTHATPAIPNNPTAQGQVTTHRPSR